MKKFFLLCAFLSLTLSSGFTQDTASVSNTLRDATIVIIRHAEKQEPPGGDLTPAGKARANAYTNYFRQITAFSQPVKFDHIFATADHDENIRVRKTLEPFSQTIGLPLDLRFKNKEFDDLAREIKSGRDGRQILICWHHGKVPSLLKSLGADPDKLLPKGTWPDDVFGWVIELHYDHEGKLDKSVCLNENLMPGDSEKIPVH